MRKEREIDSPIAVEITDTIQHSSMVKTLRFHYPGKAFAGQFFMLWIPGVDEIPMSVSRMGDEKEVTIKKVGKATQALHALSVGDRMGVRGPYGSHFEITGKSILVVAGGIGIAPIIPVLEAPASEMGDRKIEVAFGARTKDEFFWVDRLKNCSKELHLSTDDGSEGYSGFVSDLAGELMEEKEFDLILTCGPELMIKKVVDAAIGREIEVQTSLERYMKCGVGICDSCAINGLHVCRDGPIFSGEILSGLKDFGVLKRDPSGGEERF